MRPTNKEQLKEKSSKQKKARAETKLTYQCKDAAEAHKVNKQDTALSCIERK